MAVSSATAHERVPPGPTPLAVPAPIRTCVGCRARAAATELLRVVVVPGSGVAPDPRRRAPGRGAWVHPKIGCIDLAERRRAFGRALRVPGPLDPAAVREYVAGLGARPEHPTSGIPQE